MVESFSTYYGEVPLQKNVLIRKFTLYKNLISRNKLKLHRKGLQFLLMIRKFTLYYTPTVGAKLKLHRKGIKITELCLVEIAEMHYLQWFEGDCFRP